MKLDYKNIITVKFPNFKSYNIVKHCCFAFKTLRKLPAEAGTIHQSPDTPKSHMHRK